MTRAISAEELASEDGLSVDRIEWLVGLGILTPREPGPFRFGDVFRAKLVAALLEGGFTPEQVEWAVSEGHLDLDRVDEYQVAEPGPRSSRSFAEFMDFAGSERTAAAGRLRGPGASPAHAIVPTHHR